MKRALAVLLFIAGPVNAQVSGTAAPVANSSGSVTNMAIQNLSLIHISEPTRPY